MRNLMLIALFFIGLNLYGQSSDVYHQLKVEINPATADLKVSDEIKLNEDLLKLEKLVFSLNDKLKIIDNSSNIKIRKINDQKIAQDFGMDRDDAGQKEGKLYLNEYEILFLQKNPEQQVIRITYEGKIESPVKQSEENYQRGFSESPGIISELGVYLAGSTYWIPHFSEEMLTFKMTCSLPEGWKTVSQGSRSVNETNEGLHIDEWTELQSQEEIFLIAAKFNEYSYDAGNVKAMAFLRTPDEALANKYLETTAQYMEMYRKLVGPFPYSKFALVENFWETGYGMPSFTLLGEKIIRFPFILHSSYPHELLHNWWGNSVYIDFEKGNWCEGLTAYMADHLIKEQRGQGNIYRRTTLQKYADYVTPENDFPVSDFLSRYNSSSEAIGYGKVGIIFHMLRRMLGEEVFVKGIQHFNRSWAFKKASWLDIEKSFEEVSDKDLRDFFYQWTQRKGAPELSLYNVSFKKNEVSFQLEQIQSQDAFHLEIPVVIESGDIKEVHYISMTKKKQSYSLKTKNVASKINVDPMFDLFRVLHPDEVPASLSKAYGAEKTTFVLPANASAEEKERYEQFFLEWKKGNNGVFELKKDIDLMDLPTKSTVWILGHDNRFADQFFKRLKRFSVHKIDSGFQIGDQEVGRDKNSSIISSKHPENLDEVLVFYSIDRADAIPGLIRKLPHYGKYSYLAFEGNEPTNVVKGQWDVLDSPLVRLNKEAEVKTQLSGTETDKNVKEFFKREALAQLTPVFSSGRMMNDINYLASKELKGRGLGTPEIDLAASYIADEFQKAGLSPAAFNNGKLSYYQSWSQEVNGKGNVKMTNVIAAIPGSDQSLENYPVVLSAHYDHLGMGWPDVHKGDEGKIHFGADDNASGVAIMLELARQMKKSFPQRPIVFIAFTGEEAGLLGSRYYVKSLLDRNVIPFANLNLDTNGRLFDNPLLVLNGNTAREWKFIFMGTEYVTGVKTELVQQQFDASDQVAFNEQGIPAVQLFSGAHHDYHKPEDTVDKLDPNGMIKVATVAKEVAQYLGERKDAMPYTGIKKSDEKPSEKTVKKDRKAATGSMPDFAFTGKGVKIAAISEDSPAAKAGLVKGDIIIAFDGKEVNNLREYSNELKKKQPGDKVAIGVLRNGDYLEKEIILGER